MHSITPAAFDARDLAASFSESSAVRPQGAMASYLGARFAVHDLDDEDRVLDEDRQFLPLVRTFPVVPLLGATFKALQPRELPRSSVAAVRPQPDAVLAREAPPQGTSSAAASASSVKFEVVLPDARREPWVRQKEFADTLGVLGGDGARRVRTTGRAACAGSCRRRQRARSAAAG